MLINPKNTIFYEITFHERLPWEVGQIPWVQSPKADPSWADLLPGCRPPYSDPLWADPPPWMQTPPDADLLDADPLPPTLPIRQQAGGTHPIGMHTCFSRILIPAFRDFFPVFQGYCDFSSFPGRVGTLCKQHKIFGLRIGGGQLKIHQFNFVFKTINLQHPTHKENFQTLASDCTYMTIVHWTVIKLVDGGIVRPIQSHRFHLEVFAVVVRQIGAAG